MAAVYVAGRVYKPGSLAALPPGVYTVAVRTVDGFTIVTWMSVHGKPASVEAWWSGGAWVVSVAGGRVTLALSDGELVTLGPGVYRLPARPVAAWSPLGPVELRVYKRVATGG